MFLEKKRETHKNMLAHMVFVLIFVVCLGLVLKNSSLITGMQVLDMDSDEAQVDISSFPAKLKTTLQSSAFMTDIQSASLCFVINDPSNPVSFRAVKSTSDWTVSTTNGLCTGNEDLVLQFKSATDFLDMIEGASPKVMMQGMGGSKYYVLPSTFVQSGGDVVCDATFKYKFCDAISKLASPEQMIDGDLSCCLDTLTKAQKKQLEKHLTETGFTDETGVVSVEEPGSSGIVGMLQGNMLILLVFVLVAVGVSVGAMMLKGKKKVVKTAAQMQAPQTLPAGAVGVDPRVEQLKQYVNQTLASGYQEQQIRDHLRQIGWDEGTINQVFGQVRR